MKEGETIKEYFDRLLAVVNKTRLLREDLPDRMIVEKVSVSVPERFEAKISSLQDSKDLTMISLTELMNSLQIQEQRRLLRKELLREESNTAKGVFLARSQSSYKAKKKGWKNEKKSDEDDDDKKEKYSSCQHCKKTNHPHWKCWWRPDVVCSSYNQKGHMEKVCKRKQQEVQIAQETDDKEEEFLFVATCFASDITNEIWLIDSGCTNHMTHDKDMFVKLDKTHSSKVRIGNGDYIEVKGIGDIAINAGSGTKIISDVLYVPEINQNLLSVGQLLEKGYVVVFKDKTCEVFDTTGIKLMSIKMKGKSFSVNLQTNLAYSSAVNSGQIEHKRKQSRKPAVENHGKPVVKNHGLDSCDDVKVSKELIVKEIKGLDVVPKITEQESSDENVDDHPVRGNRFLSNIYQRWMFLNLLTMRKLSIT